MKLRRIHLATALGVFALVGLGSQAHAGAYAFADLEVTNFEIDKGGVILSNAFAGTGGSAGGTVNVTSVVDAFTTVATLNGTTVAQSANPSNICTGSAAGCAATGAAPFSFVTPPLTNGSFSQAADLLTGSPVANVLGLPTPANAKTAAQTQLIGLAGGNASSTLGLTSGFNFTLAGAGTTTLTLKFDGFNNLIAGLDATGLSAQASSALSFTIVDNTTHTTLLSWAPDGTTNITCTAATACSVIFDPSNLNTNAGSTTPGFVDTVTNGAPQLFEIQFTLPNSDSLTLTINHQTQAFAASLASNIPEPTTLALFGVSLLGLGWISRRKKVS